MHLRPPTICVSSCVPVRSSHSILTPILRVEPKRPANLARLKTRKWRPDNLHRRTPLIKHLSPLERLHHNRSVLQRATPGATQRSLLLDLPPEMRNRIYELALISPTPIELDADYTNGRKPTKEDSESVIKCAPLLRTCHIIRAEASDMYYGMNIFYSNSVSKMMYWIQNLTSDKQAMLKDVCSATRVLPCTDKGKLPCLLFDLALTELRLERTECQVGKDVCHIYADKYSLGESFTRSEIVASMDEEQKDMFRSHVEGGAIEADFWPMRSLLHVVCGGE